MKKIPRHPSGQQASSRIHNPTLPRDPQHRQTNTNTNINSKSIGPNLNTDREPNMSTRNVNVDEGSNYTYNYDYDYNNSNSNNNTNTNNRNINTKTPWYRTTQGRITISALLIAIISLLIATFGMGFGIAGYTRANEVDVNPLTFTLSSNFETNVANTAYSSCANVTMTPGNSKFSSEVGLTYACPVLSDLCNINTCYESDGRCHEVLKPTSRCSSTFPCKRGETCDTSTCSCVPNSELQCEKDEDCLRDENDSVCSEIVCSNKGQCVKRTTPGQQCSSNGECLSNQFCNSLCICVSAGSPSVVVYTPKVENALNTDSIKWFEPVTMDTNFFYLQFGNMVRITFKVSAVENPSASDFITTAFKFELPKGPGLTPKDGGFKIGTAVLSPNLALPSFFSEELVIFSTTTVRVIDDSGNVVVKFLNANPRFSGPLLGDVIEASGFFEYEV